VIKIGEIQNRLAGVAKIVPAAKHTVIVRAVLSSGKTVEKSITVTPVQGTLKAAQTTKEVTLYKTTPHTGSDVGLSLTAPAGANIGAVVIDKDSYAKLGFKDGQGLQLVQCGANTWTIACDDYKLPEMKENKGKFVPLKGSYSLKIQVWAAGTYLADASGNPINEAGQLISVTGGKIVPLKSAAGKAATKPVTVTVKANMK